MYVSGLSSVPYWHTASMKVYFSEKLTLLKVRLDSAFPVYLPSSSKSKYDRELASCI